MSDCEEQSDIFISGGGIQVAAFRSDRFNSKRGKMRKLVKPCKKVIITLT